MVAGSGVGSSWTLILWSLVATSPRDRGAIVQAWSLPSSSSSFSIATKRAFQTFATTTTSAESAAAATTVNATKDDEAAAAAHAQFLANCQELCAQRNLALEKVKNARDLATVRNSRIQPYRVLRTGRLSDASPRDCTLLLDQWNLTTLVDLRSPTELKDDVTLNRTEIYGTFTNLVYIEQGRTKKGFVRLLNPDEPLATGGRKRRSLGDGTLSASAKSQAQAFLNRLRRGKDEEEETTEVEDDLEESAEALVQTLVEVAKEADNNVDDGDCVPIAGVTTDCTTEDVIRPRRRERHFVSLMNEFKYVKGTLSKLRKRDVTKAMLKAPAALISRRMRESLKKPFLDEINDGGLNMLNELLLRFGAPGIRYVLELCADRQHHPVAFYCTAGKDRTGAIAALLLALTADESMTDEDIVQDYTLSANVYAEMNDHKAMVGALSQRNLNPATFLSAPPQVMRDTLQHLREEYGSIEGYCDWIGFPAASREKLRRALLDP
jgi:protein tyrosine/serine phosphatase